VSHASLARAPKFASKSIKSCALNKVKSQRRRNTYLARVEFLIRRLRTMSSSASSEVRSLITYASANMSKHKRISISLREKWKSCQPRSVS